MQLRIGNSPFIGVKIERETMHVIESGNIQLVVKYGLHIKWSSIELHANNSFEGSMTCKFI